MKRRGGNAGPPVRILQARSDAEASRFNRGYRHARNVAVGRAIPRNYLGWIEASVSAKFVVGMFITFSLLYGLLAAGVVQSLLHGQESVAEQVAHAKERKAQAKYACERATELRAPENFCENAPFDSSELSDGDDQFNPTPAVFILVLIGANWLMLLWRTIYMVRHRNRLRRISVLSPAYKPERMVGMVLLLIGAVAWIGSSFDLPPDFGDGALADWIMLLLLTGTLLEMFVGSPHELPAALHYPSAVGREPSHATRGRSWFG
jgi:hypothetical protein